MSSWKGRLKSEARSCARSTCSSPSTSRRVRSPGSSEGEEDGLTISLQVDVEAVAAGLGGGDQRRPPPRLEPGQQRIRGVRPGLVGEVDAGGNPVQQPPGED